MQAVALLAAVLITGGAALAQAQPAPHTLLFIEGHYAGAMSLVSEAGPGALQTPVIRRMSALLDVDSRGDVLLLSWFIGKDRRAAAVVGTIGPTAYPAPTSFDGLDWDCRPASIQPFRIDRKGIALRLVCFLPGGLAQPAAARIELTSGLDSARRPNDRLGFRLQEFGDVRQGVNRELNGTLVRRTD